MWRPGRRRRTRRCSHGGGSASSTAIRARLAPIGSLPAWRRPRRSWATGARSWSGAGQFHQLAQPVLGQRGDERPLGAAGHGDGTGLGEDRFGPPSPSGPGRTQRQTVGRAAEGGSPGWSSSSRGAAGAGPPASATSQRHLRPPVATDGVSPFNRPSGGQFQPCRRFPGLGHPYGPEMGRISVRRAARVRRRAFASCRRPARTTTPRAGPRPPGATTTHRSRRRPPPTPSGASTRSAPTPSRSTTAGGWSSGTRPPRPRPTSPTSPSTSPACSGPTCRR